MINLIQREWKLLLFGFLMTFWSSPGQTFFISLFSSEIRADLSLSDGEFGAAYSLATLLSAAVIVWSGAFVDRIDLRKFSIVIVIGLAFGCVLVSSSHSVLFLIAGLFLLRHMGQGLMCLTSATSLVRYLERDRGKASALGGLGYPVSEAVMPVLTVAAIAIFGWRTSWIVFATVAVLVMIPAILWLLRNHGERHHLYVENQEARYPESETPGKTTPVHWNRSQVLRDRRFYLFLPAMMGQQLLFTGYIFHQVRLVQDKGWDLTVWASLFALYAVTSVAAKLASGELVDRFGAVRLVPFILLPMGLGLLLLAGGESIWWGGAFLVLTGVTVGVASTAGPPFWAEMYGTRYLGAIKSLSTAIMVLFTALSPVVIGFFMDAGFSIETLIYGGAAYVVIAISMAWLAISTQVRGHG